jgi:hypothetical protein
MKNHLDRIALALVAALSLFTTPPVEAQTVSRIAFHALVTVQTKGKPAASYQQIFSMNPDGSGVLQLTSATANSGGRSGRRASNTSPSFAPIISW